MGDSYMEGGKSAPFGSQHADDKLPKADELDMPGKGDNAAMEEYMQGKYVGQGHPLGGALADTSDAAKLVVSQKKVTRSRNTKNKEEGY